jgi:hypothetical protein
MSSARGTEMKYRVQSKWSGEEWHTISSDRAGHQEFDDLDTAVRVFLGNTNMARMAPAQQRVIDENDKVIKYYDPDAWMRGKGDGIYDGEPPDEILRKYETCYAYNESFDFYYVRTMPRLICQEFVDKRNMCKSGRWTVRRMLDYKEHFDHKQFLGIKYGGDGS